MPRFAPLNSILTLVFFSISTAAIAQMPFQDRWSPRPNWNHQFNPNFQRPFQPNPYGQNPNGFNPYSQNPAQRPNGRKFPGGQTPYGMQGMGMQYGPNANTNNISPPNEHGLPEPLVTPSIVEKGDSKPKVYDDSILKTYTDEFPRIGGEFEPQKAIVISVCELLPQHTKVFEQIVEHTANHVQLLILCNDIKQLREATQVLSTVSGSKDHVQFYHMKMDTIWLRDFGPRMAEHVDESMSIDFFYDGQRPKDDDFPVRWAKYTDTALNKVPWTMHGGNFIANGRGLGVTTTRIFTDNNITFPNTRPGVDRRKEGRQMVTDAFLKYCNLDELVVLEPLRNEATRHVDMFAQFLAEDHILVAQIDPRYDAVNARVLNLNARKLSQTKVNGKPLKVDRIYVPPRVGKQWSPYTNTITANKMLLMPTFDSDPPDYVRRALKVYRKLLPDFYIATIDTTTMKSLQGSLHCMSINIPEYAPLPDKLVSYARAVRYLKRHNEKSEAGEETPVADESAASR